MEKTWWVEKQTTWIWITCSEHDPEANEFDNNGNTYHQKEKVASVSFRRKNVHGVFSFNLIGLIANLILRISNEQISGL